MSRDYFPSKAWLKVELIFIWSETYFCSFVCGGHKSVLPWKQCSRICVKIIMNLKRGKWIGLKIDSYSLNSYPSPLDTMLLFVSVTVKSMEFFARALSLLPWYTRAHPRPRTIGLLCKAIKLPDSSCAAPFRFPNINFYMSQVKWTTGKPN